jgi:branched-chain amino acid transport system substrate-binding protein
VQVPRRSSVTQALVLLLTLLCLGQLHGEEVVVGMSAAFKGPSRGLSIELYRGSIAYLEHVNGSGGVHGRKISIKPYDDGYNPIPAIENTIRLIEKDRVFLLFDYMGSPTVTRVLPLLKKYKDIDRPVYLFFPFTGAEPQRRFPYNEFVFNLRASYHQETAELVDRFVGIGRRKIAVFYQIDAYGRSGWSGVRETLAKYDETGRRGNGSGKPVGDDRLRIVAEATYRRGTQFDASLREQVEILRKADPDAVISISTYSAAAAFIRDARDAGWKVPIANISGVDSENLLALLQKIGKANGRDYTKDLINSQVVPSYADTALPAAKQYRELMDRYQPKPPTDLLDEPYTAPPYSYISFEGFLNAKLLVEILQKMGPKLQQSRIPQVVESIAELDLGIDVPVSFGPQRHQGLNRVYCTVVSDGRFVPLADESWERWSK